MSRDMATECQQCGANGDLLPAAHEVEHARLGEADLQAIVAKYIPTYPRPSDWEWLVRYVYRRAFERGVWANVNRSPERKPGQAREPI